jgi:hypothetical protein
MPPGNHLTEQEQLLAALLQSSPHDRTPALLGAHKNAPVKCTQANECTFFPIKHGGG